MTIISPLSPVSILSAFVHGTPPIRLADYGDQAAREQGCVLCPSLAAVALAKASGALGGQERFLSAVGQREPYAPRPSTHHAVARFDPVRPPSRDPSTGLWHGRETVPRHGMARSGD